MVVGDISATSSSSGHYQINLPAGQHALTLSVDGYITYEGTITMVSQHTGSYDFHMSPLLGPDGFRIVLTWSNDPADLDTHLQFGNPACSEIYYPLNRRTINCGGVAGSLDLDDVNGEGPETLTLSNLNSCSGRGRCDKWTYKVKNYSGHYGPNSGWAGSEAVVILYNGDHTVAAYRVREVASGGHGTAVILARPWR